MPVRKETEKMKMNWATVGNPHGESYIKTGFRTMRDAVLSAQFDLMTEARPTKFLGGYTVKNENAREVFVCQASELESHGYT